MTEWREEELCPEFVSRLWEKSRLFKSAVGLYDTVNTNENFYVGKQWEGVEANGLPTPVFNFLKKDVMFTVASITSDNVKVQVRPLAAAPDSEGLGESARILTEEIERIAEENALPTLIRGFARDAAVRGDGCIYTYWDPEAETGQRAKGAVRSELCENTRVHFGNPNDARVQSQPYIIIERRRLTAEAADEAESEEERGAVLPDEDASPAGEERRTDGKTTVFTLFYKDEKGEVRVYECTQKAELRRPRGMSIRLYPIVWMQWDRVRDSYHGEAMITGLIPNQIFVNKLWAMAMLSLMTTAYPRVVYDRTRIARWSNRIGAAIAVNGGDINTVARNMDPAVISPDVSRFIGEAIAMTNSNLGVTAAATGEVRPDNTSAIIALQRAAATPNEMTKQSIFAAIRELARIYLEFIAEYYGVRKIDVATSEKLRARMREAMAAGLIPEGRVPDTVAEDFDFTRFRSLPVSMKIDVGASSYYSEIAGVQTLDNLLSRGRITVRQYLERIPDGYIPDRRGLISEIEEREGRETK